MSKAKTLVKNATIVSLETTIHSNRPAGKLPVISLKVILHEKSMIRTLSGALFFENEEEFSSKLALAYEKFKNYDTKMLDDAIAGIDKYSIETFYNSIMKTYKHVIKVNW